MSDKFSEGYDLRSSVRIIIQQKAWYITYRDRPSMKNEHAWIWKTMDVLLLLPHKITSLSLWKLHQTPKSTERLSAKLSSKQMLLQTAFSAALKHLIEFPIHLHIPIHLFRCEKLTCMCMNSCSFSLYQIIKPLFCFCSRHLCCFQVQTHFSVMKNGRFTSGNKRGLQSTNTSAALLALSCSTML